MSIDDYESGYVPAGDSVHEVTTGVVYFVHNGRNAWHSTWVQKYYPGCMHSTLKDAKAHCESKRTNGTVFYILELPAIVFSFSYGRLIAVQINTALPFLNYAPAQERNETIHGPSTIEEVTASLDRASAHWTKPSQGNQSVILLWLFGRKAPVEPIPDDSLKAYKSFSHGKKYYLGWRETAKNTNPTRIIELAGELAEASSPIPSKVASLTEKRRQTSTSKQEQAVWTHAHLLCAALTKTLKKAIQLQSVVKVEEDLFRVKLAPSAQVGIQKSFQCLISTTSEAAINQVTPLTETSDNYDAT